MIQTQNAYAPAEETLNIATHGVGVLIAIVGLIFLIVRANGPLEVASVAVYGGTLILMFLASTLYHATTHQQWKKAFKLLDHSAIYVLIAGTYTPFLLITLDGWMSSVGIAVIWSIALFGVVFKCIARQRFPKISVATYLSMGWLVVVFIYPLYKALPGVGMWLLLAGGICFSIGVLFYVAKHKKFTHAIWHCFVMAGCACHFMAIYHFVI